MLGLRACTTRPLGRVINTCPRPFLAKGVLPRPLTSRPSNNLAPISNPQYDGPSTSASAVSHDVGTNTGSYEETGQGDLQKLIAMIPFRKLAIWGFIVLLAYQLSDFFGVSPMQAPCMEHDAACDMCMSLSAAARWRCAMPSGPVNCCLRCCAAVFATADEPDHAIFHPDVSEQLIERSMT